MRNANCTECPLHAQARTVCINGDGPKNADILVVGQNPGQQEDLKGRPFIGKSGHVIKTQIAKAELDNLRVRYTNVVRCVTPGNREPTAKEIKACRPYLDAEIARVSPKYIVPLGGIATKAIAKHAKITTAHGQFIEDAGRVIMPTYHPAASFRDPSKLTVISQDLDRLRRRMDGTLGATQDKFDYEVVRTRDQLKQFWSEFDTANDYAYDTETYGLFFKHPNFVIRCIAISFPERAWVIPLEMPESLYEGDAHAQAAFFRVLARKSEGKWVATFHGKFDCGAIRAAYKVNLPYHFDGQLAHHIFDENQDHDLKYVARIELDCPEYDLPKDLKNSDTEGWVERMRAEPESREKYWEYNARDGWNTLHWAYKAVKRLRRDARLRRLFYALSMPSSRTLCNLEAEGLPLDLDKYSAVQAQVQLERDEARRVLCETADINWDSHQQVGKVLYEQLKLPIKQRTPTGAPSTSEEAIVDLKGQHDIINQLLHYRGLDKVLGTYLAGWRKKYVSGSRIYFPFKQHGTVTGRFSSPLHPIPTDSAIRSIISTGDSDARLWDFVQADLSQAELRIAAELSGDPTLTAIYQRGEDVHWNTVLFLIGAGHMPEYAKHALETAKALNVCKRGKPTLTDALEILRAVGVEKCTALWKGWKEARTNAKRVAFGFLYGMYENTFIEKAKVDYDWMCTWKQAHAFRTGFFEVYYGLPDWHDRCKKIARIDGYVTTLFGRVRRLPAIQSTDKGAQMEAERQAVNSRVQGTIGDWKAAAMVEIDETIDKEQFKLCAEHHDALLGQVRRGCEDEVLPKIRQIMQRPKLLQTFKINMRVPMVTDIAVGPWGAGKTYRDAA